MTRTPLFAAAFALALSCGSRAEAAACTVENTGTTVCLPAKTTNPYRYVAISNESATATIACTDDGSTPAANTAGSFTFPPGTTRTWFGANVTHSGPFNCISSAASSPATVTAR